MPFELFTPPGQVRARYYIPRNRMTVVFLVSESPDSILDLLEEIHLNSSRATAMKLTHLPIFFLVPRTACPPRVTLS